MRISLLLQREPLPAIVTETLADFWSRHFERSVRVRWLAGRPGHSCREQLWLVNAYLNGIFVPAAPPAVFDPVRREFSRSPVWWKRPLQRRYVQLASGRSSARFLAHAHLCVSPPVPRAETQLVVAGNHKLRWLDYHNGVAYGLRKAGFHDHFMRQELTARQQAAACGVPVPALLAANLEQGWFCEAYVSGTPVNRLKDEQQAKTAVQQTYTSLTRLYAQTQTDVPINHYTNQLQTRLRTLIERHHLLAEQAKTVLHRQVDKLVQLTGDRPSTVTLVLSHGDFQPANILLDDAGAWLIDWEYARPRQVLYDWLVFTLSARFPTGLAGRLHSFVVGGLAPSLPGALTPAGEFLQDKGTRQQIAALFLLEEMILHLAQIDQRPITSAGSGWLAWMKECRQWLATIAEGVCVG